MISAVDLLKGIAVGAEMDNITVEGANGGLHTNYGGKAEAAVKRLQRTAMILFMYILKRRTRWDIREVRMIRSKRLN